MAFPVNEKKKTFSYAEAVALLPEARRLTEEAWSRVEAIQGETSAEELHPDVRRDIDRVVSEWAYNIMEMGIEVKGLWLIDFDNGSGYYCWRYPERGLHFFHSYEDGFSGRVPIQ
jgi:hypothetical protein